MTAGEAAPQTCEAHRAPGRPRSSEADRAILSATVDLLQEAGYAGVTIEGVAARAGVAKTTIYRRWPSKAEMVVEAIRELARKTRMGLEAPTPGGAGVRQALTALFCGVSRARIAGIMTRLAVEMAHDEELETAVRRGMIEPRRQAAVALLQRAIETGELRPDIDPELVVQMVGGPLLYRALFTGEPMDEQVFHRAVDMLMDGIRARDGS